MECKNAVLLFLFQTTAVLSSEETSTFSRSSYLTTRENTQLKGYVVEQFDSPSLLSCNRQCLRNVWCTSTNYKMSSKKEGKGTCELNKHDISLVNENTDFLDQQGVAFSILLKGCLFTSCFNGGSCLPDYNKQTFSCYCQPPWTGETCEEWPQTCKEIYDQKLHISNTDYLLKVGFERIPVYCHLTSLGACGEGGWTLVMKINGSQKTFHYDSYLWSNNETFNLEGGKTGFDSQETKLPTYWNTPLSKICLGMKIGQQNRFIVIDKTASSLYSLIADGKHLPTSVGRATWKTLIGSQAYLQANCNREGFNVISDRHMNWNKARIGILGNNEDNCDTNDSRIGFGTAGKKNDDNTCGNEASKYYGDTHIKAMGYILVQ